MDQGEHGQMKPNSTPGQQIAALRPPAMPTRPIIKVMDGISLTVTLMNKYGGPYKVARNVNHKKVRNFIIYY